MDNQSTPLCRVCYEFCGNPQKENLCSQCFEDFQSYYAFAPLCLSYKSAQPVQGSLNRIKQRLLLYPFSGHTNSRLRRGYCSTFKVTKTNELIRDISKPGFRKTLKYVKRFKDLRANSYNLIQSNQYHLSFHVIRILKGMTSAHLLLKEYTDKVLLKRFLASVSQLNPLYLTLNFGIPAFLSEKRMAYYLPYFIRKMTNLHYLGFRNSERLRFEEDYKMKLSKYKRMIARLPHLTEVSLGKYNGDQINEVADNYLNHAHLKKIQATLTANDKECAEAFFKGLGNIKQLDYLQINTKTRQGRGESNIEYYAGLLDFLNSLDSLNTLVVRDVNTMQLPLYNYTVYPAKLTEERKVKTLDQQHDSSIIIMPFASEVESLKIHTKQILNKRLKAIGDRISRNLNLKDLTIEFDYYSPLMIDLLNIMAIKKLKSFSLYFDKCPKNNEHASLRSTVVEFVRKQKELEEISIQLFYPIEYEELYEFLAKLSGFQKLKLITIYLKISSNISLNEKEFKKKVHSFCKQLKDLNHLDFKLSPNGNLTIRKARFTVAIK